jgi:predicted transcriptional regulator
MWSLSQLARYARGMDDHLTQSNPSNAEIAEQTIRPRIRSYVKDDAAFRAAVQAGIRSYEAGPNRDLDSVIADIRSELTKAS